MLGYANFVRYMAINRHSSAKAEQLSASLEDYLETILQLVQENKVARAKDISTQMQVRKSSVTSALKTLSEKGFIHYTPYGFITLTESGKAIAEDVYRRHSTLKDFFIKVLAIDAELADTGACQMEHAIPPAILDRFVQFIEFVDLCPRGNIRWVQDFGYYCRHGHPQQNCMRCVQMTVDELAQDQSNFNNGEKVLSLTALKPGQKAQVRSIRGEKKLAERLIKMEVMPGAFITLIHVASNADRIEIAVRESRFILTKQEADQVQIVSISNPGE